LGRLELIDFLCDITQQLSQMGWSEKGLSVSYGIITVHKGYYVPKVNLDKGKNL
jgi:hypothetical protein